MAGVETDLQAAMYTCEIVELRTKISKDLKRLSVLIAKRRRLLEKQKTG